jgi:RNA polymerase sigma-70 factor (ECF subfamily)
LTRFRGDSAFSTFLHRIVLNVACEHLERRRRGRGRSEPLGARQIETLIAPDASPELRARQREELARLFRFVEVLSPKRRAAFVLVAIESLPLEEAAGLLDAKPAATKQRVLEARRELARALDRAHEETT